jgi:hypothetical protein
MGIALDSVVDPESRKCSGQSRGAFCQLSPIHQETRRAEVTRVHDRACGDPFDARHHIVSLARHSLHAGLRMCVSPPPEVTVNRRRPLDGFGAFGTETANGNTPWRKATPAPGRLPTHPPPANAPHRLVLRGCEGSRMASSDSGWARNRGTAASFPCLPACQPASLPAKPGLAPATAMERSGPGRREAGAARSQSRR